LNEKFRLLSGDADTDWLFIEVSFRRAYQHNTSAASNENEAIGKSKGGNCTKIHIAVDSSGLTVYY
jgi:hypothetical protein